MMHWVLLWIIVSAIVGLNTWILHRGLDRRITASTSAVLAEVTALRAELASSRKSAADAVFFEKYGVYPDAWKTSQSNDLPG